MFSAADLLKLSGSLCINSLPLTAGPRPYRMALERSLPETLQSALGNVARFNIYRCGNGTSDCTPTPLLTNVPGSQFSLADTDVQPGQTYCYAATYLHSDSCTTSESPLSNIACGQICTNAIASMLDYIICAANNSYRFALVTTDTDGDENNGHDMVDVRVPFTSDINSFLTAITDPNLQGAGGSTPESTDECLNTVVNALTASGRVNTKNCSICSGTQSNPLQIGDFTGFRENAVRLVVLITDATPGGFCDCFDYSTDPQRVHQFAEDAHNNCIHINAIYMDDGSDPGTDSCTTSVQNIMQDYANTSCGWYEQVSNASSSSDIAVAILNMLYTPGTCSCQ